MNRIDAHHHVWDLSARSHAWLDAAGMAPLRRTFTLDDLAGHAAANGVTATVLVQVLPDLDETRDFLTLAAESNLVSGVVGWIDLAEPGAADTLAALPEGLVGVRHGVQSEADPAWLNRPDVRRGLAAVAGAGLAYDLLTLPHQLPAAIDTVSALPELTFVLDHLSKPPIASGELEPWCGRILELAARPNVYCKLSGMVTEADWGSWRTSDLRPYAETVLEAFGPERVMFGSDWPVCLLAAGYDQVVSAADELCAGLSESEREAVFAGTARRAYRLGG
ncbi:amidohydrolase family protein [Nonomuraea gerenzanensis]|uniref:L-fuconolactone hydrolase n=1 Tax=Nonomuraea gerenzanensis TaxID=93944 RepID=A0A1M4E4W9_9ACTN|nr:amidohydrolase family protein [Nonomuraea gerenzanensis]UBU16078.1 amidohydrolase family protein [Nonomuraea gerenzanensis]SBO93881.1 L-fuconolactone hydrolase [Nonomuraea gerenzanensis]